ncbi:carbohydrate-binding protein SusD [Flavihumibacter stibioxidans]|uniref:Carbohydrate-binding protein SusD n=2 Tax=Flavihumibacter stibioxidans TaxID=1834163 RepID=A0ABR7M5L3_9BACT|nr:carbohydrate-binding protein SusD [Flavihumibacter stibioxidans]
MAGCKKQLEEVKPETTLDPTQVLADPSSAFALYNGVYNTFRGYQSTFFVLGEMRSETWANGLFTESGDGGLTQFWMHNFNEANAPYNNWAGFYGLLSRINTVIKLFPQAPLTEADKNRYRGEMFGMRAYVYYTMLRTWGAVPLATEPLEKIGELSALYKHRTSADSIMLQIRSDIDSSLALIGPNVSYSTPSNPNNNKRVYWNRAATLTLKGDAYIWAATHMGGGSSDLQTAKTALEEVKNNTAFFALQNNFGDVFDPLKKNNNREIIFAINFEKDQAGLGSYGNFTVNSTQRASLIFDPPPGAPVSIVSVYPYVSGANRVGMTADLINTLTTSVPADKRMASTFRTMHNNSAPYALRGIMLTKFLGRADPISSSQIYDSDFPVYRYADVLLLLAEAKAKLNEDPSEEINAIRLRAYGTGFLPMVNGSLTENLDAILEEYKREFIGEGRYWWAMRRAGDSFVYARVNPGFLDPSVAYKMLLPITVSMLNSDPKLSQTPGYN